MSSLPPERKERLLIRLIGAAILLIVLAIAYLTYRTLPASEPDPTILPASSAAPADPGGRPGAAAGGTEGASSAAPQPESEPAAQEDAPPAPAEGSPASPSQEDPAS